MLTVWRAAESWPVRVAGLWHLNCANTVSSLRPADDNETLQRVLNGWTCVKYFTGTFRLVFTDRQPHSAVYRRRRASFSSRRCSCLKQSSWTRHHHTVHGCLLFPSQDPPVLRLLLYMIPPLSLYTVHAVMLLLLDTVIIYVTYLLTYLFTYLITYLLCYLPALLTYRIRYCANVLLNFTDTFSKIWLNRITFRLPEETVHCLCSSASCSW